MLTGCGARRFLRARKFDVEKAKQMIAACEQWRKDFGVDELWKCVPPLTVDHGLSLTAHDYAETLTSRRRRRWTSTTRSTTTRQTRCAPRYAYLPFLADGIARLPLARAIAIA